MLGKSKTAAYAIAITEENILGVIRSEAGPGFDLVAALAWLDEYQEGWFLRDEATTLDCQFFAPEIFATMYKFNKNDESLLIRLVTSI